jgi:hypothetical protein
MPRAKKPPVAPYNTGNNAKMPEPTGRAYGARAEMAAATAAAPVAGGSVPPVAPVDPAAQAPAAPPGDAQLLDAATQYDATGPGLTDPSANPMEPVTAGLPTGPGAGPGALAMPDMAKADVATWATYLPTLEYLASLPSSTATTRNFVRRLRSAIPPSTSR